MGQKSPFYVGRSLLSSAGALTLLATPTSVWADTLRGSMDARVRVDTSCRVSADPMAFGNVNLISGQVDATANIRLRCGPAIAYSVALDNGQNFNGQRRMSNGSNWFFAYVAYQIYRDAGRSQIWGATPGTVVTGVTPANGQVTLTAYGRVPNSIVLASEYQDIITVTVTF